MKPTTLLLLLCCLCGCDGGVGGTAHRPPSTVRQSVVAQPPLTILHVAFVNGTNWPDSDDWTNAWSFTALTSPDITTPLDQWAASVPDLEMYQGHLGFELASPDPQLFCAGMFQPK